jgi:glutamyl-tRNA reductase
MSLEVRHPREIIDGEAQDLPSGREMRDVVPTITLLKDHLETIRQMEVDRLRGRLGHLSIEQELAIEALPEGIMSNIMNTPIDILKSALGAASQIHYTV